MFADRLGALPKGTLLRYRESDDRRELTLKGKKRNAGLDKTREEWNIELGEGPIFEMLAAIGLVPETRYVKDTKRYELAGVVISVDQLEGVGHFCEIEAHDFSSDLDAVASVLELDPVTFEARGYPSIAAEAAEARQRKGQTEARTRKGGERPTTQRREVRARRPQHQASTKAAGDAGLPAACRPCAHSIPTAREARSAAQR